MLRTIEDCERANAFYEQGLAALAAAKVPHLVGGGYAFAHYTGIHRPHKDLDLFVHERDLPRALETLETIGCHTELTYPHWLGKAIRDDLLIDVIYGSGNGLATVDEDWFAFATEETILNRRAKLIPAEEMLWSKAFVIERERCDAADVMHLLRLSSKLDWPRVLHRFGPHYRLLYAYMVLFGFVYPSDRALIPQDVFDELANRIADEQRRTDDRRVCQGTLLSRAQYLVDVTQWGFEDARADDAVHMTNEQIAQWTSAIPEEIRSDDQLKSHDKAGRAG